MPYSVSCICPRKRLMCYTAKGTAACRNVFLLGRRCKTRLCVQTLQTCLINTIHMVLCHAMRKVIIPDEPFIFLKSDSNFLENVLKAVDLLPKF